MGIALIISWGFLDSVFAASAIFCFKIWSIDLGFCVSFLNIAATGIVLAVLTSSFCTFNYLLSCVGEMVGYLTISTAGFESDFVSLSCIGISFFVSLVTFIAVMFVSYFDPFTFSFYSLATRISFSFFAASGFSLAFVVALFSFFSCTFAGFSFVSIVSVDGGFIFLPWNIFGITFY